MHACISTLMNFNPWQKEPYITDQLLYHNDQNLQDYHIEVIQTSRPLNNKR